jgi:hypothetical protein
VMKGLLIPLARTMRADSSGVKVLPSGVVTRAFAV